MDNYKYYFSFMTQIHSKSNIKDIAIFVNDKYAHLVLRMQILMKLVQGDIVISVKLCVC